MRFAGTAPIALLLGSLVAIAGSPIGGTARAADARASTSTAATVGASPAAVSAGDVSIEVAPDAAGVTSRGQDLPLTVRIANAGADEVPAAQIQLAVSERLTSPQRLADWLNGTTSPDIVATASAPAVRGGDHVDLRMTVPVAGLGLADWGAYGIAVRMQTPVGTVPDARSGFVLASETAPSTVTVTTLVPLTAPGVHPGLLTADELTALMAPTGSLGRALDLVSGTGAVIAVDPRLIASVRLLGSAAPRAAVDWIGRLAGLPNEIFPLQYGDADPAVQREAGVTALLAPISFAYAENPSDFAAPPPTGPLAPTTPLTPGGVPSKDDILSWTYTSTGMIWPGPETVDSADLGLFAASGYATTIVGSEQIRYPSAEDVSSSPALIGDQRVYVADSLLAEGMTHALGGSTPVTRDAGLALVSAATAAMATASNGRPLHVLAAVDRGWLTDEPSGAADATVEQATAHTWTRPGALSALAAVAPVRDASLEDAIEDPARASTVSELLGDEVQVGTFSTVVSDPALLTGRVRNDLLATLAVQYRANEDDWKAAVELDRGRSDAILGAVRIVDGSTINLLSAAAEIPITISNDLRHPVTVTVTVTPSNGRLVVDQTVTVTVEAESRTTARVPVTAGVANGDVALTTRLLTPGGDMIAVGAPVTVNVSADWEGIGATILAVLVGGFFAFSIVRLVLIRRRRRRTQEHQDERSDERIRS